MVTEQQVLDLVKAGSTTSLRFLNLDQLQKMVKFWFNDLGVPALYFENISADVCLDHICTVVSSMSKAYADNAPLHVDISFESEDFCAYIIPSSVSLQSGGKTRFELDSARTSPVSAESMERFIEAKYFGSGTSSDLSSTDKLSSAPSTQHGVKPSQINVALKAGESTSSLPTVTPVSATNEYRVQVNRTPTPLADDMRVHLRFYLLQKCKFETKVEDAATSDLTVLADSRFHSLYSEKTREAFQDVVTKTIQLQNPIAEVFESVDDAGETTTLLLVSHYLNDTHGVFVGMPSVYRRYCMFAHTKYVEIFQNNVAVYAFFLQPVDSIRSAGGLEMSADDDLKTRLAHIKQDATLHYVLPTTSYSPLVLSGSASMQEMCYAYCAAKFAFHFLSRGQADRSAIAETLSAESATALAALSRLTAALSDFAFTESTIRSAVFSNLKIVSALYDDFTKRHMPMKLRTTDANSCPPNVELCPRGDDASREEALLSFVADTCQSEEARAIFAMFISFNKHVLKTNFYKPEKRAIAFRLHPDFLSTSDYPERPFGVFMIVGQEFRGFHVRFRDIARGGVRMVRSRDTLTFHNNLTKVFDECFNLASTQQRKNKDIPEGGSKGVILLGANHQAQDKVAFKKYVDAMLDLLLPSPSWCTDHYGEEELIFLGPDEGTADFMDWASEHARKRAYRYWKAFTTGKSPSRGGIPHDRFGMTTTSVRAYVDGILSKLGIENESCTKLQTGGPDGDLGSNEILMGREKTMAIVDGSGVAYDPEGLDKDELTRLAKARQMVENFEAAKFSAKGFFISVKDTDFELPDGTVVKSGFNFRNTFHLNPMLKVDVFVPCGGRPNSVTDQNYKQFLFDDDGNLRVKYVVEGANLFFTQESRRLIEKQGVKLVKDASANKGGVTSSSLEVLAALALTDEEHEKTMQVQDIDNPPETYREYVDEVLEIISNNAKNEFEALWAYNESSKVPMSDGSDHLSNKIVLMRDAIQASKSLFANEELRMKVLEKAVPKKLCAIVPFETIVERLPESYLRALFASWLSSHFVYEKGVTSGDVAFFEYLADLQ